MYNPKSLKAEEFISHEEILATLDYAEANKKNAALIDEIIAKEKDCPTARRRFCWPAKETTKMRKSMLWPSR